ncbi:hypothetical protein [Actinokineospora sp. NBRC 105648]|uniref:hypothetical protein n=1 Tax=Actinokineospora sp. NBRC 105648 TaxID=3032206 RepID=UPI0024A4AFF5|nr:hypothetical protein [Actinokineospora sp. NBRC 105648]GLZ40057.1 hypothetical protein Acsp05_36810 [Actinokineospora sp. NBRC 105648]
MTPLIRLGGWAGPLCALVLLLNAGRRAGILPDTHLGHAVAPLGQVFGLLLILGLYARHADHPPRLLVPAFVAGLTGLTAVLGVEYILNLVYPELPTAQVAVLQAGFTGAALKVSSILFLVGILAFGTLMLSAGRLPRLPVVLYVVGFTCVALRVILPTWVLPLAVAIGAVAVLWLGVELLRKGATPSAVQRSLKSKVD